MMKATWKGEEGSADSIKMHGMTFEAGKAVDVPETIGVGLLGNPFFEVEGSGDGDDGATARNKGGRPRKPRTAEEYRAYASDWLGKTSSVDDIDTRWRNEDGLRADAGWTAADQASFQPSYDARIAELRPKPPVVEIPGPKPGESGPGTAAK